MGDKIYLSVMLLKAPLVAQLKMAYKKKEMGQSPSSLGYHLDECLFVALMLVPFLKIKNLVVLSGLPTDYMCQTALR